MKHRTEAFAVRAERAARERKTGEVFSKATAHLLGRRAEAFAEIGGFEALRSKGRNIRQEGIEDLQKWVSQLEDRVTSLGGNVHLAVTSADACALVLEILQRHGVRKVVKSKSMTTEEIGLNQFLEAHGMKVVETDLGEFIIQFDGSPPSHIVGPAFHMTSASVADLFQKHLGTEQGANPKMLTRAARFALRKEFLSAGAGITGANFAAADTGTLVIVENEGNARMVATVPPVHIALLGIDKIVASLAGTPTLLRLLVRSATGQGMSSYVSFITGAGKRLGEGMNEKHLHVVLLDNGRSRILADPVFNEVLMCIRCGACLNVCPVYQTIGGHPYGFSYQGPLGAVLAPLMLGLEAAQDLPFASTLCGACREVCPMGIDLPGLLVELRSRVNEWRSRSRFQLACRLESRIVRASAALADGSRRSRGIRRTLSILSGLFSRKGAIRRLPFPLSRWTRSRDFPRLSPRVFSTWWQKRLRDDQH